MTASQMAKAIVAGIVTTLLAFFGSLGTALGDGHITATEWVIIATTTLVAIPAAFGAVWATTNAPATPSGR